MLRIIIRMGIGKTILELIKKHYAPIVIHRQTMISLRVENIQKVQGRN
jgi:hypothetical protein